MSSSMTSLILRHTQPSRNHLTPELVFQLITPGSKLWTAREEEVPFKDPFWAFYWPGGQGVARYILDNKELIKNRRVIDIGCGCGAGAIAAGKVNAKIVLANDIDAYAVAATNINADLNQVKLETCMKNYIGTELKDFDTVLVGDMFYDEEFGNHLFNWLKSLVLDKKMVIIGDPGRHGLPSEKHLGRETRYALPPDSRRENHGFTHTGVWTLTYEL